MQTKAASAQEYIDGLPADKKQAMTELRNVVLKNLPEGFVETMSYGMPGYVVPLALYPEGYHCDPDQPLGFMNIAAQKNCFSVYHMGIYADPELLTWFTQEYTRQYNTKPDIGKSCIRFKKPEHIPYPLIGELVSKMTPQQWISLYESRVRK